MPRVRVDNTEPDLAATDPIVAPKSDSTQPVISPAGKDKKNTSSETVHDHTNDSFVDLELEKKSGHSMLSAFVARPMDILFGEKEPSEELILLLRAHIVTNVPWILITFVLLALPLVLLPLATALGLLTSVGAGMVLSGTIFWYLATFTYAFISFLYWYFNVYIITSERIIDVDWYSIVVRKVSSTQIAKIQDASSLQVGVLAGIFDFGNVVIQTAGTEENFEFTAIPHPQLVAKKIEELMGIEEREMEGGGGGNL